MKAYIEVIRFSTDVITTSTPAAGCPTYSCPNDMGTICGAND